MKESKLATILALAALDDSAIKSLEERVNELAELGFKPEIVEELPESGNDHTLYLVPQNEPGENPWYKEYLWLDNEWENIGTTSINFENYELKSNKVTALDAQSTDEQYPSAKAVFDVINSLGTKVTEIYFDRWTRLDFWNMEKGWYLPRNIDSALGWFPQPGNAVVLGPMVLLIYVYEKPDTIPVTREKDVAVMLVQNNDQICYATVRQTTTGGGTLTINYHYHQGMGNPWKIVSHMAQTFQGVKTFTDLPVSTPVPTQDGQLTNKKYVDDAIAASDTPTITIDADVLNNIITSTDVNKVLDGIESNKSFKLLVHSNFMDFTSPAEVKSTGADPNKTYYIETIMNGMIVSTDTLVRDQDCTIYKDELEFTSHKVTSLDSTSTDTQYPSAKAVYDSLSNQGIGLDNAPQLIFSQVKKGVYTYSNSRGDLMIGYKKLPSDTWRYAYVTPLLLIIKEEIDPEHNPSVNTPIAYIVGRIYGTSQSLGLVTFTYNTNGTITDSEFSIKNTNNNILDVIVNGLAQTWTGVKTFGSFPIGPSSIPTQAYQLTNKKYVDDSITTAISSIETTKRLIVQTLPTQDIDTDTIYMVLRTDPEPENVYDEWMYINNQWEKIGSTEVDLTNYLAKDNTTAYIPSGEYNPSTKGYVDNYFFNSTEANWDLLTAEQQAAFAVAVVDEGDGNYELTPEDIDNLDNILGSNEPITSDMTESDAIDLTNEIIGGNN